MRQFVLPAATALILVGCNARQLTVEQVVQRNTDAMGGGAAIERIQSLEVSLHIKNPGFEVDGIYHAVRPGRMRIDIMADGKPVFMERFDGENGWQWNGKEEKQEGPIPTAALRHGVQLPGNLFGLHEMQKSGNRLEMAGRQRIDGTNYFVLQLTLKDGYSTALFVDPQTWRITRRRDVRSLHPDIDPTPTTIESPKLDWRQVDGVWFAFSGEDVDLKTGKVIETTEIKQIKINPPLDSAIFVKL